jgi:hypothetical protein
MSSSIDKNIATERAGLDALARLERRALAGDAGAMIALVDLAQAATEAVHGLWFNDAPTLPTPRHNVFAQEKPEPSEVMDLAARREALQFWCGGEGAFSFPILGRLHGPVLEKRQADILRGLKTIPGANGRGHRENPIRGLMESIVFPAFQRIRHASGDMSELEKQVLALPPLDKTSAAQWSEVAVRWLEVQDRGQLRLYDPASKLYAVADGKTERARLERKKEGRLEAKKEAQLAPLKRFKGARLDNAEQSHYDKKKKEIKRTPITRAMVRSGIKARIKNWLMTSLSD